MAGGQHSGGRPAGGCLSAARLQPAPMLGFTDRAAGFPGLGNPLRTGHLDDRRPCISNSIYSEIVFSVNRAATWNRPDQGPPGEDFPSLLNRQGFERLTPWRRSTEIVAKYEIDFKKPDLIEVRPAFDANLYKSWRSEGSPPASTKTKRRLT